MSDEVHSSFEEVLKIARAMSKGTRTNVSLAEPLTLVQMGLLEGVVDVQSLPGEGIRLRLFKAGPWEG